MSLFLLFLKSHTESHTISSPEITTISPIILAEHSQKNCIQNPKITTFMYHYVRHDDPNDTPTTRGLSVTPANFESHMKMVRTLADEKKITLLNGETFTKSFEENCFPADNIWLFTADDGWVDNAEYLAPIAHNYHIPFIFGIIEDSINKPGFITDKQVIELSKNPLFTIASHTVHHLDHSTLDNPTEEFEICQSREKLENLIQKPVKLFIFPLGKIGKNSLKHLENCDYTLAWSTHFGKELNWHKLEKYIINRVRINHDTGPKFFENLANK